jgi:hypothetical protein
MKSIIIVFISIVFFSGCEWKKMSLDSEPVKVKLFMTTYLAIIKVETKSGLLCMDAYACLTPTFDSVCYADSLGIIRASESIPSASKPDSIIKQVSVYKYKLYDENRARK